MKIKLLADENLRRAIVLGLQRREPSASFMQAYEAGAAGKDDLTVLQIAAEQNRILASHDLSDDTEISPAIRHAASQPRRHLNPQKLPLCKAKEQLLLIWLASEAEEWVNQIRFLPLQGVRCRVSGAWAGHGIRNSGFVKSRLQGTGYREQWEAAPMVIDVNGARCSGQTRCGAAGVSG